MAHKQIFHKKTISSVPLEGKTVLIRVDYNVPLDENGVITDDNRIIQSLPSLQYLLSHKCKIVICSHLGRPDGQANPKFSLLPAVERLRELIKAPVDLMPTSIGDQVQLATKNLKPGHIVVLENLRFHPQEERNDPEFAKQLASDSNADYFVQEGFGVVHRAHASTSAITQYLPSVAGKLLEKEYTLIKAATDSPKRPLVAVLGGAKISDKIKVVEKFVDTADSLIIGGAMANTFLKFKGLPVGSSLYEKDLEDVMNRIYEKATKKLAGSDKSIDDFLLLPVDVAVTPDLSNHEQRRYTVNVEDVADNESIVDIGPATIELAAKRIAGAGTVVWNGTMGIAGRPQYSYGSARIALQLAQQPDTISVIGGGDTADFVLNWDSARGGSFTHVSTGGGASLELMAGDPMPGIDALLDAR